MFITFNKILKFSNHVLSVWPNMCVSCCQSSRDRLELAGLKFKLRANETFSSGKLYIFLGQTEQYPLAN